LTRVELVQATLYTFRHSNAKQIIVTKSFKPHFSREM